MITESCISHYVQFNKAKLGTLKSGWPEVSGVGKAEKLHDVQGYPAGKQIKIALLFFHRSLQ